LFSLNNARDEVTEPEKALGFINLAFEETRTVFSHFRRIVEELKPIEIEERGLVSALNNQFGKFIHGGIKIEFSHHGIEESYVNNSKYATEIYRICLQAINNAVSHGKADEIIVNIHLIDNIIKLYVMDNGIGCKDIKQKSGLKNMEDRVKNFGGEASFYSPEYGGFNIVIKIPTNLEKQEMSLKEGI
jgi:signal transduction histidine kinase